MKSQLFTSNYLNYIEKNESEKIYYHSLFGNARLIDNNTKQILDFFKGGNTINNLLDRFQIGQEDYSIVNDILSDFIEAHFLCENNMDEREIIIENNNKFLEDSLNGFPFEFIGFNVTNKCNFACKYCIAGANTIKESYSVFNPEALKQYIFKFANELIDNGKSKIGIGFTGGEPLLYWNELKDIIIETYEKYSNSLSIEISLNTNISLVTEEIAHFFNQYKIKPFTSLDGISTWNNKVRIYKNGNDTFEDIMSGIKMLRNNGVTCDSFYLTLTKDNFDFNIYELIKFAKDNNFVSITIEPDLINVLDIDVEEICTKLIECYKIGIKNQIDIVGFWKRPYNNMVNFSQSKNGFCRALDSKSIIVDKDGYISPCGYSTLKISKIKNFKDVARDDNYKNFIKHNLRGNIDKCKNCKIEGLCKGGCLISREIPQENNAVFQYRCNIYLKMTELLLKISEYEG